ncbi:hypothetical protein FRC12_024828 [Ceratobasidium sp. 428]|nr:hypothetical protein FRC12_024828 [Ceratobasidium sp. 428]
MSTMSKIYAPERYVGLSCLSVGAGSGGSVQMLARATIIDYWGNILYDAFVRPTQDVANYKTTSTGIERAHLYGSEARPFELVQAEVAKLISNRIIVGHSLWTDLAVLGISHKAADTRDAALYGPFREAMGQINQPPGLSTLVWKLMERRIQSGYINSVENARASIDLFRSVQDSWEMCIFNEEWPSVLPPAAYAQYFY